MRPEAEIEKAFIKAAFRAFGRRSPTPDDLTRPIVITPFEGAYGPAGVVIAIQGTPPRGIIVVEPAATEGYVGINANRVIRIGTVAGKTKHGEFSFEIRALLRARGYADSNDRIIFPTDSAK